MFTIGIQKIGEKMPSNKPQNLSGAELIRQQRKLIQDLENDKHCEDQTAPQEIPTEP